jgi:hypothetical protein
LGRLKGVKQTGEAIKKRKKNKRRRDIHKKAVMTGSVQEEIQALVPEIFDDIRETYWKCLKSVPDPRNESKTVYPLYLILHRVISGFLQGNRYIGILFPIKHGKQGRESEGGNKLGALPTRSTVYGILRHINWSVANAKLAPLWQQLGYEPDLTLKREINDPVEIITDFKEHKKQEEKEQLASIKAEQEKKDRAQGMSAAQAKRSGSISKKKKVIISQ